MGDTVNQLLSQLPQGFSATVDPQGVNFKYRTPGPTGAAPVGGVPPVTSSGVYAPPQQRGFPTLPGGRLPPMVPPGWMPPAGTQRSEEARPLMPAERARQRALTARLTSGQPLAGEDTEYLQQWLHEPRADENRGISSEYDWSTGRETAARGRRAARRLPSYMDNAIGAAIGEILRQKLNE